MKASNLILVVFLLALCSCNSEMKTNGYKVSFGIYETAKIDEVPNSLFDTLKSMNIQLANNRQQSIIGYITKADSAVLQHHFFKGNFKLAKTYDPVDTDNRLYAVFALVPNPFIQITDIRNTKVKGNKVEIYFNMKGARKWAQFTKKNIGKTIVFVLDDEVYDMPVVNSEIRNGVALINNLKSEEFAHRISASLNSSISN